MTRRKGYKGYTTSKRGRSKYFYDGTNKQCAKCLEIKEILEFNKAVKDHRTGLNPYCRSCYNAICRSRYKPKGRPIVDTSSVRRKNNYKVWAQAKREAGLCISCGRNPRWEERIRCQQCIVKRREQGLRNQQARRIDGLCILCGDPTIYKKELCSSCYGRLQRNDKNKRITLRTLVMNKLGNSCSCCGEKEPKFLTIDHVNNDGNADRTKRSDATILRSILQEDRKDIQILCWNCNLGKNLNEGICPHKSAEKA